MVKDAAPLHVPPLEGRLAGRMEAAPAPVPAPARVWSVRVRRVPMPRSGSFPSGHASRGFAFAGAVAQTLPAVAAPLRLLAGAVGYSRVHTGVHYPGDVVLGGLMGAAVGRAVGWGMSRRADRLPVRTPAGGSPR